MNKADLTNEVAKAVNTKKKAQEVIDCVISTVTKALADGDAITLVGFGTFKVVERGARKGRNPQNGEVLEIKARKIAKFLPGKALREAVNPKPVIEEKPVVEPKSKKPKKK